MLIPQDAGAGAPPYCDWRHGYDGRRSQAEVESSCQATAFLAKRCLEGETIDSVILLMVGDPLGDHRGAVKAVDEGRGGMPFDPC